MEPVIEAKGLTKVYKDFWGRPRLKALDGLSLEVLPGEIFGFIGPNGSGKTTTMKLLLGLLFPSSGSARVLGRAPTDVAAKARIGFLPEESYLYRFLNADRSEEHTSELQSLRHLVCRLLLEKKKLKNYNTCIQQEESTN